MQQQDSSTPEMFLYAIIFLFPVGTGIVLFYLSNAFRKIVYLLYCLIKITIAGVTFQFDQIASTINIMYTLKKTIAVGTNGLYVINQYIPFRFTSGLILTFYLMAIFCRIIWRNKQNTKSEDALIQEFRKKQMSDMLKKYKISYDADHDTFVQNFRRRREEINIPPNMIARKITDPVLRAKLLNFERYLERGEIMEIVHNIKELQSL